MPYSEAQAAVYSGPTTPQRFARSIAEIEHTLITRVSLDNLLAGVAEKIPEFSVMRILDLGSGAATFLESLASRRLLSQFALQIISRHISIRAIGLTDSPTPEQHNQPVPGFLVTGSENDPPIEINNYYYSLTASQTLEGLLFDKNFSGLDFVNASQFFLYLSARNLRETFETVLRILNPGGKFFAVGLGLAGGPLPAFTGETAIDFRTHGQDVDSQILNLINISNYSLAGEIYALTQRSDWPMIELRLQHLVEVLTKRKLIENEVLANSDSMVRILLHQFKLSNGFRINADDLEIKKTKSALRYYYLLSRTINTIKHRRYSQQVTAKQRYLSSLKDRSDLKVEVLKTILNDRDDDIDAVLITKMI